MGTRFCLSFTANSNLTSRFLSFTPFPPSSSFCHPPSPASPQRSHLTRRASLQTPNRADTYVGLTQSFQPPTFAVAHLIPYIRHRHASTDQAQRQATRGCGLVR